MAGFAPGTGIEITLRPYLNAELSWPWPSPWSRPPPPARRLACRGRRPRTGWAAARAHHGLRHDPRRCSRVAAQMALLVACAAQLASGTHNPFIYFRF